MTAGIFLRSIPRTPRASSFCLKSNKHGHCCQILDLELGCPSRLDLECHTRVVHGRTGAFLPVRPVKDIKRGVVGGNVHLNSNGNIIFKKN